jgi:hypothetical protein
MTPSKQRVEFYRGDFGFVLRNLDFRFFFDFRLIFYAQRLRPELYPFFDGHSLE